ncbi:MAG: hypothetical protein AB7T63_01785 [Planctomycetota bacterium]
MRSRREPPAWTPKRHDRVGLERPVTYGMRVLPQAELDKLHQQNVAQEARWAWNAPHRLRRVRLNVIGAVIGMILFNGLVIPSGIAWTWWQVPVYAAYGLVVALRRPGVAEASLSTVAAGLVLVALAGRGVAAPYALLACVVWGALGAIVGADQEGKRMMGPES